MYLGAGMKECDKPVFLKIILFFVAIHRCFIFFSIFYCSIFFCNVVLASAV